MIPATIHQLLQATQPRDRDRGQSRSPLDMLLLTTTSAETAWQIREAVDAIRAALARFDEIRLSLASHYGRPGENGSYTFETEENQRAFLARYEELLNYRVEMPIEALGRKQLAGMSLSASDLDALAFLLEEPAATEEYNPLAGFAVPELEAGRAEEAN